MIRNFIYYMPIVISVIGILSIVFAIKNKSRNNNKFIIVFNIINILYLFVISVLIHNFLPIIVDLTILIIWLISIIGGILYLISTIICICKRKKLNDNFDNKLNSKIFKILIVFPIIVFALVLFKETYLINNSEFILEYQSDGNGGFGDSHDFVYVISDKYCTEISVDADLSYNYYNRMLLSKNVREVNEDELQNKGYKVVIDNQYIIVYKNQKLIHKKKLNDSYFNIELDSIYYNEK